jgi:hypothetical protein
MASPSCHDGQVFPFSLEIPKKSQRNPKKLPKISVYLSVSSRHMMLNTGLFRFPIAMTGPSHRDGRHDRGW